MCVNKYTGKKEGFIEENKQLQKVEKNFIKWAQKI